MWKGIFVETIIEGIKTLSVTLLYQYNSKPYIIILVFRLVNAGVYQQSKKKLQKIHRECYGQICIIYVTFPCLFLRFIR